MNNSGNRNIRENYCVNPVNDVNSNFYPNTTYALNCMGNTPMSVSFNNRTAFDKAYDLYYGDLVANTDYSLIPKKN